MGKYLNKMNKKLNQRIKSALETRGRLKGNPEAYRMPGSRRLDK